jgi:hypothetical protein
MRAQVGTQLLNYIDISAEYRVLRTYTAYVHWHMCTMQYLVYVSHSLAYITL